MMDFLRFKEIHDLFTKGHPEKARYLLMEMQSRCIALRDEISVLKSRLQELEDTLEISKNLFRENGLYWLRVNGIRQGPFCPHCHELEGSLIRLVKDSKQRICPCCHEKFPIMKLEDRGNEDVQKHARILPFPKKIRAGAS